MKCRRYRCAVRSIVVSVPEGPMFKSSPGAEIGIVSSFIQFIQAISIAPVHVNIYSEALPTQHGYCAGI